MDTIWVGSFTGWGFVACVCWKSVTEIYLLIARTSSSNYLFILFIRVDLVSSNISTEQLIQVIQFSELLLKIYFFLKTFMDGKQYNFIIFLRYLSTIQTPRGSSRLPPPPHMISIIIPPQYLVFSMSPRT